MRKRNTATDRNRARDAINAYSSDLLKKLQNTNNFAFSPLLSVSFHVFVEEASGAAGAGATGWATRTF
jgi:hypothetical protein